MHWCILDLGDKRCILRANRGCEQCSKGHIPQKHGFIDSTALIALQLCSRGLTALHEFKGECKCR